MKATPRSVALLFTGAALLALGVIQIARAQEESTDQKLEEVFVKGLKPIRDSQTLLRWLPRLVGTFTLSGTLRFHHLDDDSKLEAMGTANCIGVQGEVTPAVHCQLVVRWLTPGGGAGTVSKVPAFQPAVMLFGHSRDLGRNPVIRHLLVDSDGKAEGDAGVLVSTDTMVSRAKCLNGQGTCQRVVRITAAPDLRQVKLEIGIATQQNTGHTITLIMARQQTVAPEQQ